MSFPDEWRNPDKADIAGDPTDDDASYFDEMLDETAGVSPTLEGFPDLTVSSPESELEISDLPPTSEIITLQWPLAVGAGPMQLLPRDPYRTELWVSADIATEELALGSSLADVSRQVGQPYWHTREAWYSVTHTGALWVSGLTLSAPIVLNVHAVTCPPPSGGK